MPPTVLAGNWKMNTDLAAAVELATGVRAGLDQDPGAQVILCPPFISLSTVADAVRGSSIQVGAQNMHFQDSGAFTGEIAPSMLRAVCDYVILGHSERRQLFGETDQEINLKVQAAFRHGLQPILCVGETLEEREAGRAGDVVETQLRNGLADLVDIRGLIVAYEPVWAIGTGQAAHTGDCLGDYGWSGAADVGVPFCGHCGQCAPALRWQRKSGKRGRIRRARLYSWRPGGRRQSAGRTVRRGCEAGCVGKVFWLRVISCSRW